MRAAIILIALLLLTLGTTQASTAADVARAKCDKTALTQYAMDKCAQAESQRVDAQEAALYKRLVIAVGRIRGASVQVQAAESSWKQYRTEYMKAMWGMALHDYGSVRPLLMNDVYTEITQRHIAELNIALRAFTVPGALMCASKC